MGIVERNGFLCEKTEGSAFAVSKLTTKETGLEHTGPIHSELLSVPVPPSARLLPERFN